MEKNLRIRTNVAKDSVLNVQIEQDVDTLEILSLELNQKDTYRLHSSNYGIVVGRVLANDAFGIPNVKVSVFVPLDDVDAFRSEIKTIYPYADLKDVDKENREYNLLPDESNDECYRIIGTFPNKRLVLDNNTQIEVFDKYWKYTTVTNSAGDYMIYGVPTGSQQVHVDLDLSDIGVLSQKPRDMLYKGYNIEQFDSPTQFKESTNFNNVSQIIRQDKTVYVYPFWGDEDNDEIAITRCDVKVDYKFEPTCVFMGSLITDNSNNVIDHNCSPSKNMGFNRNMVAGEGTIEMIRKTVDGLVEEFQIKGNKLIDSDGVWCYQIPMNLDYVKTDEYGNIVPTDNPNEGIPTRTKVRFRISFGDDGANGSTKHRAKYLVPNNPELIENSIVPTVKEAGENFDKWFEFGSATPEDCFRDLFWNKVYTIKSFIPRIQLGKSKSTQKYSAIRTVNTSENLNPFPFNKVRAKLFFGYRVLCFILTFIGLLVDMINSVITAIDNIIFYCFKVLWVKICPFSWIGCVNCVKMGVGLADDEEENIVYAPGCKGKAASKHCWTCEDGSKSGCRMVSDYGELKDKIQQLLSEEYDMLNLDFYNDWVNGCLYFPQWYWKKTKKWSFFFGLFTKKAKNTYCDCDKTYKRLKNSFLCGLNHINANNINDLKNRLLVKNDDGGNEWIKTTNNFEDVKHGIVKEVTNRAGLKIYYYTPGNIANTTYLKDKKANGKFVRLYATDIVLLGSFNDCDLDGVPKLYKSLPSTTANIPFLSRVVQPYNDADESYNEGTDFEQGELLMSGMDWGKDGAPYKNGLFFDLSCTSIKSKPKTCINAERLSELGVTLDMTYSAPYGSASDIAYYTTFADGLITRYEIDDSESRYMFATLNHNGLNTLIKDEDTNYNIYKFAPIYPREFDGALGYFANKYTNGEVKDNPDANYVRFRLGDNPKFYNAYHPLYNNSFYFYFGLNDGNTAIDKFKSQYDAVCSRPTRYPFSYSVTTIPANYCNLASQFDTITKLDNTQTLEDALNWTVKDDFGNDVKVYKNSDFAAAEIKLDDIRTPYSYVLTDEDNNVIVEEDNVSVLELKFGHLVASSGGSYVKREDEPTEDVYFGLLQYINSGKLVLVDNRPYEFGNGTYFVTITDAQSKSVKIPFTCTYQKIGFTVEPKELGTKFYNSNLSKKADFCNENDQYYGEILVSDFTVDGDTYRIDEFEKVSNTKYLIKIYDEEHNTYKKLQMKINSVTPTIKSEGDLQKKYSFKECNCSNSPILTEDNIIRFKIWKPAMYTFEVTEIMGGKLTENKTIENVTVENGSPFNSYINDMPVKFLLGGDNDHKFYKENLPSKPTDLNSWFNILEINTSNNGTNELKRYDVYDINDASNLEVYSDLMNRSDIVLNTNDDGSVDEFTRLSIIRYLLGCTFSLANGVYVTDNSDNSLTYRVKGGKSPQIIRSVYPYYSDSSDARGYMIDSVGNVTCDPNAPTIIGSNYISSKGTQFNTIKLNQYGNANYMANYFAVFTNGGGIKNGIIDASIKGVQKEPLKTYPFPEYPLNSYTRFDMQKYGAYLNGNGEFNAYLAVPFIDRRLGYDIKIITMCDIPAKYEGKINISGSSFVSNYNIFKITTYNGVEMAHDDTKTDDEGGYSIFDFNDRDGSNLNSQFYIGNDNNIHYNTSANTRFYTFSVNGVEFKDRLKTKRNQDTKYYDMLFSELSEKATQITQPVVFENQDEVTDTFNEDNYPIIRSLHAIAPRDNRFTVDIASFSLTPNIDINTIVNEENTLNEDSTQQYELSMFNKKGEEINFDISLNNNCEFITYTNGEAQEHSYYTILSRWEKNNAYAAFLRSGYRLVDNMSDNVLTTRTSAIDHYYGSDLEVIEACYTNNQQVMQNARHYSQDLHDLMICVDFSDTQANNGVWFSAYTTNWHDWTDCFDNPYFVADESGNLLSDDDVMSRNAIFTLTLDRDPNRRFNSGADCIDDNQFTHPNNNTLELFQKGKGINIFERTTGRDNIKYCIAQGSKVYDLNNDNNLNNALKQIHVYKIYDLRPIECYFEQSAIFAVMETTKNSFNKETGAWEGKENLEENVTDCYLYFTIKFSDANHFGYGCNPRDYIKEVSSKILWDGDRNYKYLSYTTTYEYTADSVKCKCYFKFNPHRTRDAASKYVKRTRIEMFITVSTGDVYLVTNQIGDAFNVDVSERLHGHKVAITNIVNDVIYKENTNE